MSKKDIKSNLVMALIASLTLGLTPFFPEPHLWGKIKWVMGGAKGMQLLDYWDLIMHGFPWIMLFYFLILLIFKNFKTQKNEYSRNT
ncbi:MAG: hypothetical protein V3V14_09165 [Saprospiraceae bacterium]